MDKYLNLSQIHLPKNQPTKYYTNITFKSKGNFNAEKKTIIPQQLILDNKEKQVLINQNHNFSKYKSKINFGSIIQEKINIEKKLKENTFFTTKEISKILMWINDENIDFAKIICSYKNLPYSQIIWDLIYTNKTNSDMAQKLYLDNFIPKNKINLILHSTKDDNIEHKEKFYNLIKKTKHLNTDQLCFLLIDVNKKNINFLKQIIKDEQKVQEYTEFILNEMINKKNILKSGPTDITNSHIKIFVDKHSAKLYLAKNLLGNKFLLDTFHLKTDGLSNFLEDIDTLWQNTTQEEKEALLEIFNPTNSTKGKKIKQLLDKLTEENKELSKIKDLSKKIKPMAHRTNRKKKLKKILQEMYTPISNLNTNEKILKLKVLSAISSKYPQELLNFIKPIKTSNETEWNNQINKKIFENLNIPFDENLALKLNFHKNEYLARILSSDQDFNTNLKNLIKAINKYPKLPIEKALDHLPQNKKTKKDMKKRGINYSKWTQINPACTEKILLSTNKENLKKEIILTLEETLSDLKFKNLPLNEINKIFADLKTKDITLSNKNKLYFQNTPITFSKVEMIISTIKQTLNQSDFWFQKNPNLETEKTKNLFLTEIKLINQNFRNAKKIDTDKTTIINIKKADMTDLSHALFLGNYSSCCTAVGSGSKQFSAPNYIKNRFISAIEILDDNKPIGNTMCYLADVNGQTSLILDNIELNSKYAFNEDISNGIFNFAQKLCADISKKDNPIYLGNNNNKVSTYLLPLNNYDIKIIGSSAKDLVYIDSCKKNIIINGKTLKNVNLYKIK